MNKHKFKQMLYESTNILVDKNNIQNIIIFEIGCATGEDTQEFFGLFPKVSVHCFEPEKENIQKMKKKIKYNNFFLFEGAVSDICGKTVFYKSNTPYSSSIVKPKNHLKYWPSISFEESYDVETITLDKYCKINNVENIDLIWADVQGAEKNMILGASEILNKTKFLYTEYSSDEYYEDQANLIDISNILGKDWKIVKDWNENRSGGGDVLFVNKKLFTDDISDLLQKYILDL